MIKKCPKCKNNQKKRNKIYFCFAKQQVLRNFKKQKMENLVLDYSSYIEEYNEQKLERSFYRRSEDEWGELKDNYESKLYNNSIFQCPYCFAQLGAFHKSSKHWNDNYTHGHENLTMLICICGYWSAQYNYQDTAKTGYGDQIFENYNYMSILKHFQLEDKNIPLDILSTELKKNPKVLYSISPSKMEDLVGNVFGAYFNCEVEFCGKSHDGGVDLIIIQTDDPILVQVKRRENPNTVESVSLIRDLLGAMFIKNSKKAMFVSTADRYSKDAHKVREELLMKNRLDYFELINFNRFIDIFSCVSKGISHPWSKVHKNFYDANMKIEIHDLKMFVS
jgi:hypothetical protein